VARVGLSHALSILLGCQKLSAQTLIDMGYLQQVVPPEDLLEVAAQLARDVASFPAGPLAAMKQALLSLGNALSQSQQVSLAAAIDPLEIGARIEILQKSK
jgi:enoyl-CoA hydratase/carnithine racemase